MFKIFTNVNRSGKQSQISSKSANIPFDPYSAFSVGEFVTFVTNSGMLAEPEQILQYDFPRTPRPVYAVFYTPREIEGRAFCSIDMILYADSYENVQAEDHSLCVVLGHGRNLTPGSIAPFDPQCLALGAKYEGIAALIARNAIFIPTFFRMVDGAAGPSMWTAAMDMTQPAAWTVDSINWNDGNLNNIDLKFARSPVSEVTISPLWFPYVSMDEARTKYPVAVAASGTNDLYWACWRPTVAGEDASGNKQYNMQTELFSQNTMTAMGGTVKDAAQLFFLDGATQG